MKDDFEEAKLAASFLGINDFGPNNSYIINQDLDDPDKSITRRQATKFTTELSKRLLKEPSMNYKLRYTPCCQITLTGISSFK